MNIKTVGKKTFTFGHDSLQNQVRHGYTHSNDIRVVGVSVVSQEFDGTFTKLEKERISKWHSTVKNVAKLPVSWSQRAHVLLSTQSQATLGKVLIRCVQMWPNCVKLGLQSCCVCGKPPITA